MALEEREVRSNGNMERDMEKGMSMIVLRKDGRIIMFINGKSSSVGTSRRRKNKRWRWRRSEY